MRIWYSTEEVAAMLGYSSRSSVTDLIHRGDIKARKSGNRYKIPRAEVERLSQAEVAS